MLINEFKGNYEKEVLNHAGITAVKYFATWCGPCKMLSQVIEDLDDKYNAINLVEVDIDEYRKLAIENDIMSVPTTIIYVGGKEVNRVIGYKNADQMKQLFDNYLN